MQKKLVITAETQLLCKSGLNKILLEQTEQGQSPHLYSSFISTLPPSPELCTGVLSCPTGADARLSYATCNKSGE